MFTPTETSIQTPPYLPGGGGAGRTHTSQGVQCTMPYYSVRCCTPVYDFVLQCTISQYSVRVRTTVYDVQGTPINVYIIHPYRAGDTVALLVCSLTFRSPSGNYPPQIRHRFDTDSTQIRHIFYTIRRPRPPTLSADHLGTMASKSSDY